MRHPCKKYEAERLAIVNSGPCAGCCRVRATFDLGPFFGSLHLNHEADAGPGAEIEASRVFPGSVPLDQGPYAELFPDEGFGAYKGCAYFSFFLHIQFIILNAGFFALHTGHSSGASPSAVNPQTWQT